jgi:hypothetical protein
MPDRAEKRYMFSVPAAINPINDNRRAKLAQNTAPERPNSPQDRQKPVWTRILYRLRRQNGLRMAHLGHHAKLADSGAAVVPLNRQKTDQEGNARLYELSAVTLFAWICILKVDKDRLDGSCRLEIALGSERACPPEDVGGVWGYAEFLEAIADPKYEQHDDFVEWAGEFDPEEFDADKATKALRQGLPNWRQFR